MSDRCGPEGRGGGGRSRHHLRNVLELARTLHGGGVVTALHVVVLVHLLGPRAPDTGQAAEDVYFVGGHWATRFPVFHAVGFGRQGPTWPRSRPQRSSWPKR